MGLEEEEQEEEPDYENDDNDASVYMSDDDDEENTKKKSEHVNWIKLDKKSKETCFWPNVIHFLPKWMDNTNLNYWLNSPEYVVYKENQVRIRYIVQLKNVN